MNKLRHLTNNYPFLSDAPTPEDVLYHCKRKNKKSFDLEFLEKDFTNKEAMKQSLDTLEYMGNIRKTDVGFVIDNFDI
jgi:hypothetical protein